MMTETSPIDRRILRTHGRSSRQRASSRLHPRRRTAVAHLAGSGRRRCLASRRTPSRRHRPRRPRRPRLRKSLRVDHHRPRAASGRRRPRADPRHALRPANRRANPRLGRQTRIRIDTNRYSKSSPTTFPTQLPIRLHDEFATTAPRLPSYPSPQPPAPSLRPRSPRSSTPPAPPAARAASCSATRISPQTPPPFAKRTP